VWNFYFIETLLDILCECFLAIWNYAADPQTMQLTLHKVLLHKMPVTFWCAPKAGKRVELFVVEAWMHSSQVKCWGVFLYLLFTKAQAMHSVEENKYN